MKVLFNKTEMGNFKNNIVALGSFDGLHLGHLTLINKVIELSKEKGANSMVYTFLNHPRSVVRKDNPPKLLMDNKTKEEVLESLGIDLLFFEEFTTDFMKLTPEDFIKYLVNDLGVTSIVVGFNYRFGYKNSGDVSLLKELSKKYGYDIYVLDPRSEAEIIVSSTTIREALESGDLNKANYLLSRAYSLRGEVTHGKKLGRKLGYPTANLKVREDALLPKLGVYYTNVKWRGKIYKGITSVGMNPTVNGKNITVETFILDFDHILYGEELIVYFVHRIRDELKFDSLDELILQLQKDEDFAKKQKIYVEL